MAPKNPSSPNFPDEEAPTQPDRIKFRCPNCSTAGETLGYVIEETWAGNEHQRIQRTCDICWGQKWIDRAALNRWALRQRG